MSYTLFKNWAFLCCCSFALAAAHAESVYYEITSDGRNIPAQAAVLYAESVPYVSLNELLAQIGGSLETVDGFCRATYTGIDVTLEPDTVAVATPGTTFSLIYPTRLHEKDVYIAQADIPAFFSKAYAAAVKSSTIPPPDSAQPPADNPALDEDPGSLLETLPLPEPENSAQTEEGEPAAADTSLPVGQTAEGENTTEGENSNEGETQLKSVSENAPITGIGNVLILDAGHGGQDIGASAGDSLMEKDIALALLLKTRGILKEKSSLTIHATRDTDKDVPLNIRANLEGAPGGSLLISIHTGYSLSPGTRGVVLFVDQPPVDPDAKADSDVRQAFARRRAHGEQASKIAYAVAQSLAEEDSLGPVTVRKAPLLLQHLSEAPCIMIELAFLSNPDIAASVTEEAYQVRLAEALANAIITAVTDTAN